MAGAYPADDTAYIAGEGDFAFDVEGTALHQDALEWLAGGRSDEAVSYSCTAVLARLSEDSGTIGVAIRGTLVGMLDPETSAAMLAAMQSWNFTRGECEALVEGGWYRSAGDKGDFRVRLDMHPQFMPETVPLAVTAAVAATPAPASEPAAPVVPAGGSRMLRPMLVAAGVAITLSGLAWLFLPLTPPRPSESAVAATPLPTTPAMAIIPLADAPAVTPPPTLRGPTLQGESRVVTITPDAPAPAVAASPVTPPTPVTPATIASESPASSPVPQSPPAAVVAAPPVPAPIPAVAAPPRAHPAPPRVEPPPSRAEPPHHPRSAKIRVREPSARARARYIARMNRRDRRFLRQQQQLQQQQRELAVPPQAPVVEQLAQPARPLAARIIEDTIRELTTRGGPVVPVQPR